MRILLVSANFRPSIGGIERFTEVLAEGLAERGHAVTVLCCGRDGAPRVERSGGTTIVRIPATSVLQRRLRVPYPLPSPLGLLRTPGRLLGEADVVHVQDAIYTTSVATLIRARQRGVPSVMTQHVAFVPQANAVLDAAERLALGTLGRAARLATQVVTLNPAVGRWVAQQWNVEGVRVLPVGVPPLPPVADPAAVRASFGLPQNRFVALFVGRDVPKKGLDHVVAAADPAYEIVAVTDGVRSGPGVRCIPFMAPERLHRLLSVADAFVLPSVAEGFPVAMQEALSAGLPVVASAGEGYERYLRPGEVMVVERDAEAIRSALTSLAADPDLRRRQSRRSREAAEREFGVDRFVDAYERLYEELVGAREPSDGRGYPAAR